MKSYGKALGFGVLIWLFVFAVAFIIFPLREGWRALFESIMPVAVTGATCVFALIYFRDVPSNFFREGVLLGLVWFAISFLIDLPLMLTGPISMSFVEYVGDIGVTYLIIPMVTTAVGIARSIGASARTSPPSPGT